MGILEFSAPRCSLKPAILRSKEIADHRARTKGRASAGPRLWGPGGAPESEEAVASERKGFSGEVEVKARQSQLSQERGRTEVG